MATNLSLLNATSTNNINTNFQRVAAALANTLGRDGSTPNQMNADLDLNSNDLLNVNILEAEDIRVDGQLLTQRLQDVINAKDDAVDAANASANYRDQSQLAAQTSQIQAELAGQEADRSEDEADRSLSYVGQAQAWASQAAQTVTGLTGDAIANSQYSPGFTGSVSSTIREVLSRAVSPYMFGAVGDGIVDDTLACQRAINTGRTVLFANGTFAVSRLTMTNANQRIVGMNSSIRALNTSGSELIFLEAQDAILDGLIVVMNDATKNGITVGGGVFGSAQLIDLTVTGTSLNALLIQGLETAVIRGKYKGGTSAGIRVEAPDTYLANVYVEGNRDGLYAASVGSIDAHHVHSFGNTRHGFFLASAAYSHLVGCYADTNGQDGFNITSTNAGLSLISCWGYKSSTSSPGSYSDFAVFGVKNTAFINCQSSGDDGNKKASFNFNSACQGNTMVACTASLDGVGLGDPIRVRVSGGTGVLARYNLPENRYNAITTDGSGNPVGSITLAAGATTSVVVPLFMTGLPSSPGFTTFEIESRWRFSSGAANVGAASVLVLIGNGVTPSTPVQQIYPTTTPTVTVTSPSLALNATTGLYELTFNVTNGDATRTVQLANTVEWKGTGRSFA